MTALLSSTTVTHADIASLVPEGASGFSTTQTATADHAMVVTAHPLATQAALDILKRGGSAADATITAQLVLGLVEPQSSGIGGGAFLVHWSQTGKKLTTYDGRETAPQQSDASHFLVDGRPMPFLDAVVGGKGVGTPGVVALLALTHKQHGRLPWKTLFEPAIALADEGFRVSTRLSQSLQWLLDNSGAPAAGEFRSLYFDAEGKPRPVGYLLKNPTYAAALQAIASDGEAAFYRGELARRIENAVTGAARPGQLRADDLARYRAIERPPLCKPYRQYRICGAPPPSSGAFTVLSILGQMEKLAPTSDRDQTTHRFIEASRLAFADRNTYLADPDFVPQPLDTLLGDSYLKQRAKTISPNRASSAPALPGDIKLAWQPARSPELPSTMHLVITDVDGNIVSMTSSIEMAFGSQLMTDGFLLNNQLTDFSFVPRDGNGKNIANRIEPGKRPRSSMAPIIVFEKDQPVLALGSPGGARIIDYVARVLVQHLASGAPLADAITAPNVIDMNAGVEVETRADADALATALQGMGHQVKRMEQTSGLHAIRFSRLTEPGPQAPKERLGKLLGVADPRREGQAAGY
jgi:gamma-glutamyltranspeptidase/glutathione hydrolase